MQRRVPHFLALVVLLGLSACAHSRDITGPDIAGLWKHADKSAWIQIDFQGGVGSATITQHDGNAAAQGLAILQGIRQSADSTGTWHGKIYSAEVDDFVDVSLVLMEDRTLVISTVDGTGPAVEVLRLIRD